MNGQPPTDAERKIQPSDEERAQELETRTDFAGRSRAIWGDQPNRKPLSETIIDDRKERV